MRYVVIGDEETVLGFALAGIEGKISKSQQDTERYLNEYTSQKDVGIIIITDKLAQPHIEFITHYTYSEVFPLIVIIPDRNGYAGKKLSIEEVLKKSVGIKI